ncbi:molybdopterin molybdotransferase MoeA [bacterium]|nr:molybdopterin molybdotransferase MoeA [bacterium]
MRDHSAHIEMGREQAIGALLARCAFAPPAETVGVRDAIGRVLARDVTSQVSVPGALTCRMDSVAVRFDDFVDGDASADDVAAGACGGCDGTPVDAASGASHEPHVPTRVPDTSAWDRGAQWQFANTGVAMPAGFDTAVRIEDVTVTTDESGATRVAFRRAPHRRGEGTEPAGSRMRPGDLIAAAGTTVSPLVAAGIATGGHAEVAVIARPRVAFIPTGNELVPVGVAAPVDKNLETNSIMIAGKVRQWGGEPVVWPIVPDDRAQIKDALLAAVRSCDIVVINGGSSKGSDDWTCEVLEEIGEVLCHEIAHGPGHHTSLSVLEGKPVIGISGPPMGAEFTTDFYLLPVMQRWFGREERVPRVTVTLAEDFPAGPFGPGGPGGRGHGGPGGPGGRPMRPDFFAVRQLIVSRQPDGTLAATPVRREDGVAVVSRANAFYRFRPQPDQPKPHAGDQIEVELRWPYAL